MTFEEAKSLIVGEKYILTPNNPACELPEHFEIELTGANKYRLLYKRQKNFRTGGFYHPTNLSLVNIKSARPIKKYYYKELK